jgi:hypothetical protein
VHLGVRTVPYIATRVFVYMHIILIKIMLLIGGTTLNLVLSIFCAKARARAVEFRLCSKINSFFNFFPNANL